MSLLTSTVSGMALAGKVSAMKVLMLWLQKLQVDILCDLMNTDTDLLQVSKTPDGPLGMVQIQSTSTSVSLQQDAETTVTDRSYIHPAQMSPAMMQQNHNFMMPPQPVNHRSSNPSPAQLPIAGNQTAPSTFPVDRNQTTCSPAMLNHPGSHLNGHSFHMSPMANGSIHLLPQEVSNNQHSNGPTEPYTGYTNQNVNGSTLIEPHAFSMNQQQSSINHTSSAGPHMNGISDYTNNVGQSQFTNVLQKITRYDNTSDQSSVSAPLSPYSASDVSTNNQHPLTDEQPVQICSVKLKKRKRGRPKRIRTEDGIDGINPSLKRTRNSTLASKYKDFVHVQSTPFKRRVSEDCDDEEEEGEEEADADVELAPADSTQNDKDVDEGEQQEQQQQQQQQQRKGYHRKGNRYQPIDVSRYATETKNGLFQCKTCQKEMKFKDHVIQHCKQHINPTYLQCNLCNYSTGWVSIIRTHMRQKHGKQHRLNYTDLIESAEDAGRSATGSKSIKPAHIKIKLAAKMKREYAKKSSGKKPRLDYSVYGTLENGRFNCNTCNRQFNRVDLLMMHGRGHSVPDGRIFLCKKCPFLSRKNSTMYRHMNQHGGGRVGDYFDITSLKKTASKITNDKECYICPTQGCSMEFQKLSNVQDHIYHHFIGVEFFVTCKHCDKKFRFRSAAENHIAQMHKDACKEDYIVVTKPDCTKFKAHQSKIKQQNNTSGTETKKSLHNSAAEARYRCSVSGCAASFRTLEYMKEHIQQHKAPDGLYLRCLLCELKFRWMDSLHRHMRTHHSLTCGIADKGVLWESLATVAPSEMQGSQHWNNTRKPSANVRDRKGEEEPGKSVKVSTKQNTKKKPLKLEAGSFVACPLEGCAIRMRKSRLKEHKLQHKVPDGRYIQCKICNLTFRWRSHLCKHHLEVHKQRSQQGINWGLVESAKESASVVVAATTVSTKKSTKMKLLKLKAGSFVACPLEGCAIRMRKSRLKEHKLQHKVPDGRYLRCEICNLNFRWRTNLSKHLHRVHKQKSQQGINWGLVESAKESPSVVVAASSKSSCSSTVVRDTIPSTVEEEQTVDSSSVYLDNAEQDACSSSRAVQQERLSSPSASVQQQQQQQQQRKTADDEEEEEELSSTASDLEPENSSYVLVTSDDDDVDVDDSVYWGENSRTHSFYRAGTFQCTVCPSSFIWQSMFRAHKENCGH